MKKWGVFLGVVLLVGQVAAFDYGAISNEALMMGVPGNNPDPKEDEEVVKAFQAIFIKNMFLRPTYGSGFRIYQDDDSGSDYTIYNEMLLNQLADQFAEDDILGLKSKIEQGIKAERKKQKQY